jgi:hypothetical protein
MMCISAADKVTLEDQGEHGEVAGGSQEDDDSDFEFEEMETENIKQSPNKTDTEQRGQKRNVCS